MGAAVFHADFCIDPFPNRVAGCASGQESEQCAGDGSDACSGCRAEYGNEGTDGGTRRRAGTESGVSAACSDCSSDDGSRFSAILSLTTNLLVLQRGQAGTSSFTNTSLMVIGNSARLKGQALRVLFIGGNQIAGCPAMRARCSIPNMEGASSAMLLITLLVSGRRERMDALAMPIP